jgi:UDP-N-acetylmuramoyl-tripeptide--D-alanyl-D-alanine ligase
LIAEFEITAGKIAEITGGKIEKGNPSVKIKTITSDSREIREDSLFVALSGEKFDGHSFITSLSQEGKISAYLAMKDVEDKGSAVCIKCGDTLKALGAIGNYARGLVHTNVIGVTGTNGKTTTKEIIYTILSAEHKTLKSEKNYNNEIGVPFTLMNLRAEYEFAVIEMGMNHTGEISRLSKMAMPEISVITGAGEGHLEFLGSVENVARAKSEIMDGMREGTAVFINKDTQHYKIFKDTASKKGLRAVSFGITDDADIYPEKYSLSENSIKLKYAGVDFDVPLYGIHNLYNVMAGIAVAGLYGLNMDDVSRSLKNFINIGGRSQIINKGYIIIDDSYNSNPLSSRYALRSIKEIYPGKRKIAVLSDMKELGKAEDDCHIEIGKEAAVCGFDMLLLYGKMSEKYMKGALSSGMKKDAVKIFSGKDELSAHLKNILVEDDVVLIKGSRSMKMEDVVKNITGVL